MTHPLDYLTWGKVPTRISKGWVATGDPGVQHSIRRSGADAIKFPDGTIYFNRLNNPDSWFQWNNSVPPMARTAPIIDDIEDEEERQLAQMLATKLWEDKSAINPRELLDMIKAEGWVPRSEVDRAKFEVKETHKSVWRLKQKIRDLDKTIDHYIGKDRKAGFDSVNNKPNVYYKLPTCWSFAPDPDPMRWTTVGSKSPVKVGTTATAWSKKRFTVDGDVIAGFKFEFDEWIIPWGKVVFGHTYSGSSKPVWGSGIARGGVVPPTSLKKLSMGYTVPATYHHIGYTRTGRR